MSLTRLANSTLKKYFSFSEFRPGQLPIVLSLLERKDTLAILPTGGGKSICFQVPALIFPGTTIVISPLISLMQDQVEHLLAKNIPATFLNSQLSRVERMSRLKNLAAGQYKLLYLAPESLANQQLLKICQQLEISFLVVDEAHCVSIWGHQFRPSYLKIPEFLKKINKSPKKILVSAFTATATPRVKMEICKHLELDDPKIFLQSFLRENLIFHNLLCADVFAKNLLLFKVLKQHRHSPTIIYCSTRLACQQLKNLLEKFSFALQRKIAIYHGGLEKKQRQEIQAQFLSNQLDLIIATNAFGMGVDKDNINLVLHYQIPASLENYYQEAGRAGRNGQLSYCYLLYLPSDLDIQAGLINKSFATDDLELNKAQAKRQQIEIEKLKRMEDYALSRDCLESKIDMYFSEKEQHRGVCQHCANCLDKGLKLSEAEEEIYQKLMTFNQQYYETVDCQLPPILFTSQQCEALAVLQPQTPEELSQMPGIGNLILKDQSILKSIIEILKQKC